MNKQTKIIALSLLALILLGWVLLVSGVFDKEPIKQQATVEQNTEPPQTSKPEPVKEKEPAVSEPEVKYTDEGYTPTTLTIKKGQRVLFSSNAEVPNWIASDYHPSHALFPEFDAYIILDNNLPNPGDPIEFTFDKVGTWAYHNHNLPEHVGIIIVTE